MTVKTAPKNKRLSQGDRDTLLSFASKQIRATEETADLDASYERAADAIYAAVIAKHPQKDMAVLARYGAAAPDACVYVSTGGSNYDRFLYRPGDKRIALRPDRGCNRQPVLLEGDGEAAYEDFKAKTKAHDDARAKRLADFKALIFGSTSFNAVVDTWPAAEVLRESIVGSGTSLAVLSSEVVDRLKADPALMAQAA
jgi:hypothetical protein